MNSKNIYLRKVLQFGYGWSLGKQFLLMALGSALVLALILTLYHYFQLRTERIILQAHEQSHVTLAKKSVAREFESISSDLLYLARSGILRRFLDTGAPDAAAVLTEEFILFSQSKRLYDQIRLIDETGMEVVRVDIDGGNPQAVMGRELQDKSRRYYFKDAFMLARGKVFVSPLDLNTERGVIEEPLKPTLRFGTPVYDTHGQKRGVVFLNYFGALLLGHLRQALEGSVGDAMLLNNEGYWLLAPNPEDEWGFMFQNDRRFGEMFPAAWERIATNEAGQFSAENCLFTFTTVYPLLQGQRSSSGSAAVYGPSLGKLDPKAYYWKLVSHVRQQGLGSRMQEQLGDALFLYGVLLSLAAAVSWYVAGARVRNRLAQEELRLSAKVMQSTAEGAMVTDAAKRIVRVNHGFSAITGYTPPEVIGKDLQFFQGKSEDPDCFERLWTSVAGVGQWRGEILGRRKNDEAYPAWLTMSAIKDPEGRLTHYVGIFSDITDRVAAQQKLEHMAHYDALTGLPNRCLVYDRLNRALARGHRYKQKVGVLFLDLDQFKPINDELGHEAGDAVLKVVANRLSACVRETDTVARVGGDEFLVILQDLKEPPQGGEVAKKIVATLSQPVAIAGQARYLGVSVGISVYPDHGEDADTLVKHADAAMYAVKNDGKNGYRFFAAS